MKAYIASLRTETNSFVERPTRLEDFNRAPPSADDAAARGAHASYFAFVDAAREAGFDIVRGPAAYAVPGGPLDRESYQRLRADLLAPLSEAPDVDLVLLDLHGAMAAEGEDDCEGDVLAAVRSIVGPRATVVSLLDPHAALSARMLSAADILHAYKEYPHTDVCERALELFGLARKTADGALCPVPAVVPCRSLGGFPTTAGPMKAFVAEMKAIERREAILSVSLIHGFPWSDCVDNGAEALVYADRDAAPARAAAREVAERFLAIRDEAVQKPVTIEEAVRRARGAAKASLILADVSDNPGGGATGEATHLLAALRAAGVRGVGAALVCDPEAARACLEAGLDAELDLSIGGRVSAFSGEPLQLRGRVAAIGERAGPDGPGAAPAGPIGPIVRFQTDFADLFLGVDRREVLWRSVFTVAGADPADYAVLVLKSSNHFRAAFEPLGREILSVGSPTAMNPELASLPYRKLPRPMWPIDDSLDVPVARRA